MKETAKYFLWGVALSALLFLIDRLTGIDDLPYGWSLIAGIGVAILVGAVFAVVYRLIRRRRAKNG
ncbi:MAG TPA: hypothetical protein PLR32_00615 [candidate division Zixibacteria bacterium]|nr:hypothetical protein [candidate division Zixibacteria bacterium]MDD4916552.1 hypothetical protein [candidate division Zixibacteria bacterium]MDM7974250.1 hypothetical protein [candidate division Zixibacteria bacterium]HOD65739.1 hypothetical protein [candidate division Zixibacteria bacterium]HPC11554.1 hypothetical protein [candidate division Zixibacteria bacterium]